MPLLDLALASTSRSHFSTAADPVAVKEPHAPFPYQGETHQAYYEVFGDLENGTRTPVVVVHCRSLARLLAPTRRPPLDRHTFPTSQLGHRLDEFDTLLQHLGIRDPRLWPYTFLGGEGEVVDGCGGEDHSIIQAPPNIH